jgi:DNA mismatch endonuclease, patch repair protein
MTDIVSKHQRSVIMSKVRGRGNKSTEIKTIKIFRLYHITGWRRNQLLLGKPDFVFRKNKLAIFVDGCFWHSCPKHSRIPKSNTKFWSVKLTKNKSRDKIVNLELKRQGWKVLRIWEHDLSHTSSMVSKIKSKLSIIG